MNEINIEELLGYLGKAITSLEVESFLNDMKVRRRPSLDEEDIDKGVYNEWLLIKRLGLELEFKSQAIFEAFDEEKVKQTPLLLTSYIFYSNRDGIKDYASTLPLGLEFTDTPEMAREKLGKLSSVLKSYIRDVWTFDNFTLIVSYNEEKTAINDVTYLLTSNFNTTNDVAVDLKTMTELLGVESDDQRLSDAFSAFDFNDFVGEKNIITPRYLAKEYGLGLDFSNSDSFINLDSEGTILSEIIFYRKGYLDMSYGYAGKLPYGLDFDDSPKEFMQKINTQPVDQYETESALEGQILWVFPALSMKIVYSLLMNNIARIHIYPEWYWDDEDKEDWEIEKDILQ